MGIQFGAGGATAAAELKAEGTRDPEWAISQAKRFVDAGAPGFLSNAGVCFVSGLVDHQPEDLN